MLVRRFARPLLAAWFVVEGMDAVRRPVPHSARTEASWRSLAARSSSVPAPPGHDELRTLVRAHGAAMTVAGLMLATGRAPRFAALALAALTAPLAVINHPFGTGREEYRDRFWRNLSMIGGALIAGVDHEGRPGAVWRVEHARVDKAAARQARHAIAEVTAQAKSAARAARRAA